MNIEMIYHKNTAIAVVSSEKPIITDAASAMDLMMSVKYETGATRIILEKSAVCEDFFILSTGLAGEILQKCINYQVKFAIYGDYSKYNSKPLHDFIYEANHGKDFFFVETKEAALDKLSTIS